MAKTSTKNGTLNQRQLLAALRAFKKGDFKVRLPDDQTGLPGAIAEAFNEVVSLMEESTEDLERISNAVGKEGRITQRMTLPAATGGKAIRGRNGANPILPRQGEVAAEG